MPEDGEVSENEEEEENTTAVKEDILKLYWPGWNERSPETEARTEPAKQTIKIDTHKQDTRRINSTNCFDHRVVS
jgi:hypothetical protein